MGDVAQVFVFATYSYGLVRHVTTERLRAIFGQDMKFERRKTAALQGHRTSCAEKRNVFW